MKDCAVRFRTRLENEKDILHSMEEYCIYSERRIIFQCSGDLETERDAENRMRFFLLKKRRLL